MEFSIALDEFDRKVKRYFYDCEEKRNVFPDEGGMLNFLEIEDEEYEAMKTTEGFDKIIRWAKRRRTSWLEREMVRNKAAATGCMNALKQEKNGGYTDRPQDKKQDRKLIVRLEGVTEIGGNKK